MSRWPNAPAWRHHSQGETAREAALAVTPSSKTMMQMIVDLLGEGPASPEHLTDKLTDLLGRRVLLTSVRARVCQLRAQGRVVDSGFRDIGESGRVRVIRWRLATADELAAFEAAKAEAVAA